MVGVMTNETASPSIQNGRGIALMACGMFLFSAVDTMAKVLTETVHPMQVVWLRQSGLLLGALVLLLRFGRGHLATQRPGLQISRGLCAIVSAAAFITAIRYVHLADAVAVSFIAPFIVTVLGAVLLREPVGLRRWTAVFIGFLATMVIIRPGQGAMHPAILLVLLAASVFALRQVLSRILGATEKSTTTFAYTAIVGWFVLLLPLPFVWTWPSTGLEVGLMVAMAVLAAIAEFMVIKALELAQSVAVAPVHYTILIWSTAYGFLVFGHLPDGWTVLGASVIMLTGLYTLHRESLADRARRVPPPAG